MKFRLLSLIVLIALVLVGIVPLAAQEATPEPAVETYQVPGFPAYSPAPTMLELVEDRGETVVVRHLFGETEMPKNPERVVVDPTVTSIAWALDLPVILADYYVNAVQIPELDAWLDERIAYPSDYTPNFEELLQIEPDLILVYADVVWSSADPQTIYDQLSMIAPTLVFFASPADYWQQATIDLAHVLGIENVDEYLQTDLIAEAQTLCEPLQRIIGDQTVIHMDVYNELIFLNGAGWMDEDRFAINGQTVPFYQWCGLNPPEFLSELVGTNFNVAMSQELIPQLQSDYLFIAVGGEDGMQTIEDLLDNPLWQAVPAVRNGNVYIIPGISAHSAPAMLYAIEAAAEAVIEASN
jgi:ABC-type Fe3+-hydroxamate transport system substrate-binding protein